VTLRRELAGLPTRTERLYFGGHSAAVLSLDARSNVKHYFTD